MFVFALKYEENNAFMSNDDLFVFYQLYFDNRTKLKHQFNWTEQIKYK